MEQSVDEITCVAAFGDRIFTGDASGTVRCYDATATDGSDRESEATRCTDGKVEALSMTLWEALGVAQGAISVRTSGAMYGTVP